MLTLAKVVERLLGSISAVGGAVLQECFVSLLELAIRLKEVQEEEEEEAEDDDTEDADNEYADDGTDDDEVLGGNFVFKFTIFFYFLLLVILSVNFSFLHN